jgi:hypothetical protein
VDSIPSNFDNSFENFLRPQDSIAWDKLRTSQPGKKQEILLGLLVAHPEAVRIAKRSVLDLQEPPSVRQDLLRFIADESPETATEVFHQMLQQPAPVSSSVMPIDP